MHTGTEDKNTKTEVIFIPRRRPHPTPPNTCPITLSDGTRITFYERFTYLGSVIHQSLSDDEDVHRRITKATQAFGSLRSLIFGNPHLPLKIKQYLYMAIPVNLLLCLQCYSLFHKVHDLRTIKSSIPVDGTYYDKLSNFLQIYIILRTKTTSTIQVLFCLYQTTHIFKTQTLNRLNQYFFSQLIVYSN